MEKDRKTGNSYPDCFAAVLPGLSVFYAVISAYVVNYRLKIGTYHVWLCSAVGAAAVVFSVWAIILCAGLLIRKKGKKGYNICVLVLALFLLLMGADSTLPYCRDLIGGKTTVKTNSYLVVRDKLYFLDDNGSEVALVIPKETADELRSKENYEYDSENNLLRYYKSMTVTYYPNSGVITELLSEN